MTIPYQSINTPPGGLLAGKTINKGNRLNHYNLEHK